MKSKQLVFFLAIFLSVIAAYGQQALIKGRISDPVNRERLTGATISLSGTPNRTVSDVNGEFFLYLQPGKAELTISYIGYRDTSFRLELKENEIRTVQVNLSSANVRLSSVVVSGFLQGQAKALNQQKNADNIKNVVSAD
ncbi:MAG TPA: carboxypeptidase-like regulatory domain-containing protein, partial [Flavisolibacter sp.]|nr:carboxypeptidase-like regulatory domain-containing protein [Flavisolibacter sp.]